jgi:hypothetical protein
LGKRDPFSLEPGAAVPEVEQYRLGQAEPQRQLRQEEYDQGYVGRSADNAKESGRHGRADEISDNSVMGAGSAPGAVGRNPIPSTRQSSGTVTSRHSRALHRQNSLIITWVGVTLPPLGAIASDHFVATGCTPMQL